MCVGEEERQTGKSRDDYGSRRMEYCYSSIAFCCPCLFAEVDQKLEEVGCLSIVDDVFLVETEIRVPPLAVTVGNQVVLVDCDSYEVLPNRSGNHESHQDSVLRLDGAWQQRRRVSHHHGRRSLVSPCEMSGMEGLSRFERFAAAASSPGAPYWDNHVDLVPDYRSLVAVVDIHPAVLGWLTVLFDEDPSDEKVVLVHHILHTHRTRPSRPNHRHRRSMTWLPPISSSWPG